jgi:hypothetical protein
MTKNMNNISTLKWFLFSEHLSVKTYLTDRSQPIATKKGAPVYSRDPPITATRPKKLKLLLKRVCM